MLLIIYNIISHIGFSDCYKISSSCGGEGPEIDNVGNVGSRAVDATTSDGGCADSVGDGSPLL